MTMAIIRTRSGIKRIIQVGFFITAITMGLAQAQSADNGNDWCLNDPNRELRERAAGGNVHDQFALCLAYHDGGLCIPRDFHLAAGWCRMAADSGNAYAQIWLADMYSKGEGVQQSYADAFKWYLKAAELGMSYAQFNVGLWYTKGQGVPQNYAEAVKWYRKAAEQGIPEAQSDLGYMYSEGQGVSQNYPEAQKWLRKAAKQGNATAQFNLGLMYAQGQGVPQNYVYAYAFLNLAAVDGGSDKIRARDSLLKQMTPDQISKGQALSANWRSGAPLPGE